MKSKISLLFIFLISLISCSFSKKKIVVSYVVRAGDTIILTENYINLCYGMETEADTNNFMEHAMQLLNASDYKGCLALFKTKYSKLDTVIWHSGFYGLIIPDSNIQSYKGPPIKYNPFDYLSFRYNNFLGDLVNDEQSWIFTDGVDASDKEAEFFKFQIAESDGLLMYDPFRIPDSVIAKIAIKKIGPLLQDKYKGSRRLEYMLATAYLVLGDDGKATGIYDKLIGENYYALPCLKNIISYLGDRKRTTEQEKYVAIFNKMFPNECLLIARYNQSTVDSVRTICKKCITMGTQRDSIHGSIFLANYFLNQQLYKQFDSLTDIYFKQHIHGSYDMLKKTEESFYSEIKIRELFLLKQYGKMYFFYYPKHLEKTENQNDFKEYVKRLYATYMPTSPLSFEVFFKKNFW